MILINGCSFTTGEESPESWADFIPNSVNIVESYVYAEYIYIYIYLNLCMHVCLFNRYNIDIIYVCAYIPV